MPMIQVGSRPAVWNDISKGDGKTSTAYGRGYRRGDMVPIVMSAKHRPGKYEPHYGKKESAKLAARVAKS